MIGLTSFNNYKCGFPLLRLQVTEVFSQTRNGEHVRITITLTNELPPTSPTCLQFYNIIFRRYVSVF